MGKMNAQETKLQAAENDLKQLMANVPRAREKAQEVASKVATRGLRRSQNGLIRDVKLILSSYCVVVPMPWPDESQISKGSPTRGNRSICRGVLYAARPGLAEKFRARWPADADGSPPAVASRRRSGCRPPRQRP